MLISTILIEYMSLDEVLYFDILPSSNNCELIVSSNSEYLDDKQKDIISRYSSNIHWIFNSKNGGFAYGMNEGLKIAKGDVLVVMNPDVKLKSSIDPMIEYLKSHPEVGIIGPKIVDKEGILQDSFRSFATPFRFFERQLGRLVHRDKLHVHEMKEPTKVDWVIGAFMMVRRDFYEKVGGLSEDYFMYCEDMDWCKRAHQAGYDVVYFPDTVIEYKGTRSARKHWKYAKIHIKSLFTYWCKYGVF